MMGALIDAPVSANSSSYYGPDRSRQRRLLRNLTKPSPSHKLRMCDRRGRHYIPTVPLIDTMYDCLTESGLLVKIHGLRDMLYWTYLFPSASLMRDFKPSSALVRSSSI